MNKADLVDAVANSAEIPKSDAAKAVDAVFESITAAMAEGDSVSLIGFGTFQTSDRPARTGRNPRTGESIAIPAARVPKFKAGKGLKDAVN